MSHLTTSPPVAPIQSQCLFRSDCYEIKHWAYDFTGERGGIDGYNDCFCLVFINSGNFAVDLATRPYELHTGHVVVEKADYVYKLRPSAGICSIFNFTADFYEQFVDDYSLRHASFFANPNWLTLMLTTSPAIDYLHHCILNSGQAMDPLERDCLVFDLVQQVVERIENHALTEPMTSALKTFHLTTIEQAKDYLNREFNQTISLLDLASHCCVSPFHLSRLFRDGTGFAPHQYLVRVRLAHAERLLEQSTLPVADVCYASGFNSPEHFATAFRQQHKLSPTQYRKQVQ